MWVHKILVLVLMVAPAYCMDKVVEEAVSEASKMIEASMTATQETTTACSTKPTPSCMFNAIRQSPSTETAKNSQAAEILEMVIKLLEAKGISFSALTGKEQEEIEELAGCQQPRGDERVRCRGFRRRRGFRTFDGTCNNLYNRVQGATLTPFRRDEPAAYENGVNEPKGFNVPAPEGLYFGAELPSARLVSTTVVKALDIPDDPSLSHMVFQWGQFLDHDVTFTSMVAPSAEFENLESCADVCVNKFPCFPIIPPENDTRIHDGECIGNTRSAALCRVDSETKYQREQFNSITSYIDASNVYGSDKESADTLRELDDYDKRGNLRVKYFSGVRGDFLPEEEGESEMPCLQNPAGGVEVPCFAAGDIRVNEQIGLTAMHTLWVREHNRIAAELRNLNPHWDGERVYQEARKIVGAMHQIITYREWLPKILGETLPDYTGYDNGTDATIENIFGVAVFRFGHGLIRPITPRLNEDLKSIPEGNIALHETFFSPWLLVQQGGIEPVLRGLYGTPAKMMSPEQQVTDEVTERLFALSEEIALDLAALNIQRARDHGLPFYNTFRERCGLETLQPDPNTKGIFNPLKDTPIEIPVILKIEEVYENPVIIDPWVGMLSENLLPGARVGPTFKCLLEDQFTRLRDGDRFWWQNRRVFTRRQRRALRRGVSFSRVLCDNGIGINRIQEDAFMAASVDDMVPCDYLRELDLSAWAEDTSSDDEDDDSEE